VKDECVCSGTLSTATVKFIKAKENQSGKENLVCKGEIPPTEAPPHKIICQGPVDGVCTLSGVEGGFGAVSDHAVANTRKWEEVIKKSGKVTLQCHDLEPLGS
jgi:hypothetical protein